MKELLKITHINDDICEIVSNISSEEDEELLSACILGILGRDSQRLRDAIMVAAMAYLLGDKDELRDITKKTMLHIPGKSEHAN